MKNCILAGVGGQGTVLASRLIAQCAMMQGRPARTAETIGMAQRGGCVVSHVRVGKNIYSPLVPLGEADIIIGFEPAEAVRCLPYLKKEGMVVVSSRAVKPTTDAFAEKPYDGDEMLFYLKEHARTVVVDVDAVCKAAGSAKVLNIALLGAAISTGAMGLTMEDMKETMKQRLPEKFLDMNFRALEEGENGIICR